MSASYVTHCAHQFVDAETWVQVEPYVNVLAASGRPPSMTRGRKYVCERCQRSHDFRSRLGKVPPELEPAPRCVVALDWSDWTD